MSRAGETNGDGKAHEECAEEVAQDKESESLETLEAYLIFVIFFTRAKFLENKIYTKKTRNLRQNTQ